MVECLLPKQKTAGSNPVVRFSKSLIVMKKQKIVKKKVDNWRRFKRFVRINLFVQQIRIKTFGWWYWVDLSATVVERLRPVFETFMLGLILNDTQRFVTKEITSLNNLYWYIGLTIGVRLFSSLYTNLYRRYDWYFSVYAMQLAVEKAFINKLIYLDWEHIENPQMEKRINRIFNRAADYIVRLADVHVDIVVAGITLVSTFLLVKAPLWVILLTFAKEVPSLILTAYGTRLHHKAEDDAQYDWIRKGTIFDYFRTFSTLLEIKTSQGQKFLQKEYEHIAANVRQYYLKKDKKLATPWLLVLTFENIINSGIYVYYLAQVLFQGMLLGTFQYTTNLISQIGSSMYRVVTRLNQSVEYYRYVSYAHTLLEQQNDRPEGTKVLDTEHIEIEFKNVWFKYPGSKKYSLKDVSFKIHDNERIAIVGENGAGKSTFLKLLNRIYLPTKGEIFVNGIPSHEYTTESYNGKISVVTQDFARYGTLTVAQNISIYDKKLQVNMEQVKKAANLADADTFIEKLPNKYSTFLTKRLEGGTELSTGQWQRIAVARQFYANRPLVVLDEPTSAIDPIAEAKIFTNLYEHVKDKTVIVVSHRYNTVRAAQKILVFNDGKIIEQGTHDELLSLNGYYAKAFAVQQEEKKL